MPPFRRNRKDYNFRKELREVADREKKKAKDEAKRRSDDPWRKRGNVLGRIFSKFRDDDVY